MSIKKLIRRMFLSAPKKIEKGSFYLKDDGNYSKYSIGAGTYGKPKIHDWKDNTELRIGNYCSIAKNVDIMIGGEHHSDWVTTYPFKTLKKDTENLQVDRKSKGNVLIGNDVWIGMNSTILSGVTIGNGAIIGAGSIVTKNVPSYAIYAGNPAKLIKYRFSEDVINELNKIEWWHWDEKKLIDNYSLLLSDNIDNFLMKHKQSNQ